MGAKQRCRSCYFRHQGITERVEESRRRAGMVPDELKKRVVPERLWPTGTRWCAGCQSFVDVEDVGKNASRCKACMSASSHAAMIKKTYDIDTVEYERLFKLQDGRCAICRNRPKGKRLAVDHSHVTGEVRGLLCSKDNHELLGAGYDSTVKLLAAVHYLQRPPASGLWTPPEDGLAEYDSVPDPDSGPVSPPKASRLADPPGARVTSERPGAPSFEPVHTIHELTLIGGGRDENGFYRLYQHKDDTRIPF